MGAEERSPELSDVKLWGSLDQKGHTVATHAVSRWSLPRRAILLIQRAERNDSANLRHTFSNSEHIWFYQLGWSTYLCQHYLFDKMHTGLPDGFKRLRTQSGSPSGFKDGGTCGTIVRWELRWCSLVECMRGQICVDFFWEWMWNVLCYWNIIKLSNNSSELLVHHQCLSFCLLQNYHPKSLFVFSCVAS